MIHKKFAENVVSIVRDDQNVIGLAAAGSWISNEMDEYSDLDLVLITKEKIAGDKEKMINAAKRFGNFISGFTGEHIGEPRVLICLFDDPLLHVDIKFLTLPEFEDRVENPTILFERDNQLSDLIARTKATWPRPDPQWIEDRFWTWIHYLATKLARGEYLECIDGLGFIRARVLAPMIQQKNNQQARGLRKVEMNFNAKELEILNGTLAENNRLSISKAIDHTIEAYQKLRDHLLTDEIQQQQLAEQKALVYFKKIKTGF